MLREGRIIQGRGGLYTVRDAEGQDYVLRAKNRFRYEGISPLVGDLVSFTPGQGEEHGWLEDIRPRTSVSIRPPVANITQLIITLAAEPEPDLLLVDKLLIFALEQDISVLLAVNKSDLDGSLAPRLESAYTRAGIPVLAVSATKGMGLDDLVRRMEGHINCFAGQSDVGKSTLISRLTGLELEIGDISQRIRRGKQTTRHISLLEAEGLKVLDTPGFSLLELPTEIEPEHLRELYPEFAGLQQDCRFEVCLHNKEPGCAVDAASEVGGVDAGRLARYRLLLEQQQEKWSNRYA